MLGPDYRPFVHSRSLGRQVGALMMWEPPQHNHPLVERNRSFSRADSAATRCQEVELAHRLSTQSFTHGYRNSVQSGNVSATYETPSSPSLFPHKLYPKLFPCEYPHSSSFSISSLRSTPGGGVAWRLSQSS